MKGSFTMRHALSHVREKNVYFATGEGFVMHSVGEFEMISSANGTSGLLSSS